ncbi:MAG TPA: GlsB/YeaQ/YmgE family stress response membrane protein [Candidatus Saccharimonadales bacterium]|nr:GlsB/YeaQ/YmgE family stress response membrane protein [Candidatus Saccharimonadales bacterium]
MNILGWIVLGAIAGHVAGLLVKGDEGLGVIGHVVLGIVGAIVGGFLAAAFFSIGDPIQGALDLRALGVAVVAGMAVVIVVNLITGRRGSDPGAV